MSDYFPFWMFCSVVAVCVTWYKFNTRHDVKRDDQ